jgi:four helix bundle protein
MAKIERFEDILSWQKARELTREIYALSKQGEFARDFALKDQLRRAAVSVMSNIAEGFERGGDQEFIQFLAIAKGSAGEIRSQLHVAFDQGYLTEPQFQDALAKVSEIGHLLAGFMDYLRQSELKGAKYR